LISIIHVFEKDSFKIQEFMEDEKIGIKRAKANS
jgi:hypothetical protein